MSQFRGYTCDGCGNVIAEGHRTRHTEKFDGPTVQGEVVKDLCPVCVNARKPEDGISLKPLRRRRVKKGQRADSTA